MAWHGLSCLIKLLWTFGHAMCASGRQYYNPQEQSWKNQDLNSVPDHLDVRLRRLDMSNNFITQLHTLGLPHLRCLDVSYNQLDFISEGAFVNLARLEELNLARNALNNNLGSNSKALQSVSGLRALDISMNGLNDEAVELYLRNKSSLVQLKLAGNGLTRLTRNLFRDSKCLRTISIDNNLITHIEQGTFEPLRKLEALNLARNNLAHICDFKLHQVKYLNLSQNSIEFFVTQEDHKQYRLETLDLSHNKLLYFPIVPKINRLRHLYVQNNMVGASHSEEETLVSDATSLYKELTSGEDNAVENNNVYSNWRLMPLVYMDLSNNNFRSFPLETLSLLTSLETLNFSNNCLQTISYNITKARLLECHRQPSFSSLRNFALQNNGLVHISPVFLEALTNLETLNLQENYVKPCAPADHLGASDSEAQQITTSNVSSCVAFGQIKTLKHLNLEENAIKILYPDAFEKNPLVSLNLARNPDMIVQVGALEGLQSTLESLSISETNATSSGLSLLPCMPALTRLNISNNRLDAVPGSLSCSRLRELDIRNNAFRSLNHSLIRDISAHLDVLYVGGNHFNCCDSQWLTILNALATKLPDIGGAECVTGIHNVRLTDYLKEPSIYCPFHIKSQEVSVGQATIIFIFVSVVFTMLIIFIREGLCHQKSFVV